MFWTRLLADLVVVIHAAYVAFVLFGMVAIVLGLAFRRGWSRNFWFRTVHLAMIGVVAALSIVGTTCPLTDLENSLRERGAQEPYPGAFIGYWAHRLIYFDAEPWVFTVAYVLFGAAVLFSFMLAPPRWPRRERV